MPKTYTYSKELEGNVLSVGDVVIFSSEEIFSCVYSIKRINLNCYSDDKEYCLYNNNNRSENNAIIKILQIISMHSFIKKIVGYALYEYGSTIVVNNLEDLTKIVL